METETKTTERNAVINCWRERVNSIPKGTRGRPAALARFEAAMERLWQRRQRAAAEACPTNVWAYKSAEARRVEGGLRRAAVELARRVTALPDEHGFSRSDRGEHYTLTGVDFVAPRQAAKYMATPGTCLGLVNLSRTRVYPHSCKWRPSTATQKYLIGTNEAGTGFAHPVAPSCSTVEQAVCWIWGVSPDRLLVRQGDIALISGNGGPRMPRALPSKHVVEGDVIVHPTHPAIPLPAKGQRLIVGRRAADNRLREGHGD